MNAAQNAVIEARPEPQTTLYGDACHVDFPKYIVRRNGEVISVVRSKHRTLAPIRRGKYLGYTLFGADGKSRPVYQHRIIAEVFLGAAPHGHEARHLDGNRANNSADNLRWGTRKENMADKVLHGTAPRGEAHPMAKMTDEKVRVMRRLHKHGISPQASMRYFGVSRMTHWRIINRQLWSHIS